MRGRRIAIIDLGTNSVRFDVHEIEADRARILHREKLMVRLGQGVFARGALQREGIRRTLAAFRSFAQTARVLGVQHVAALGTSALREAANSRDLVREVARATGITIRVISGQQEAELIARGIIAHETRLKSYTALVDIGGGSTEISCLRSKKVKNAVSLPLGTARLQETFLEKMPPKRSDIRRLREHIRAVLHAFLSGEQHSRPRRLMGSSGTVRALARMLSRPDSPTEFSLRDLSRLVNRISRMDVSELLLLPRLEPRRADMILAGAILLEETAEWFGSKRICFTPFALREGILELERYRRSADPRGEATMREEAALKAEQLGLPPPYVRGLAQVIEACSSKLAPEHQMSGKLKILVECTALLKDVGKQISPIDWPSHTAYILRSLDLADFTADHFQLMSQLVLGLGGPSDAQPTPGRRSESLRRALGFLQLIDAIAIPGQEVPRVLRVKRRPGRLDVILKSSDSAILAELRIDQARKALRRSWGREVFVCRAPR